MNARSASLALIVLISAVILVWMWSGVIYADPGDPNALSPSVPWNGLYLSLSLISVLTLQILFAWIARPLAARDGPSPNIPALDAPPRDMWRHGWVRFFVSFCWSVILAIFLFVILVFVFGW